MEPAPDLDFGPCRRGGGGEALLANLVAGAFERSEGAVGAGGVGVRQASAPAVIAIGGDIEEQADRGRRRFGGAAPGGEQDQQEEKRDDATLPRPCRPRQWRTA